MHQKTNIGMDCCFYVFLSGEVDTVKEQVVSMEANFLLWRTKVHNDQMAQQEEFLQERLVKQDRVSYPSRSSIHPFLLT
jgi:hypothetical protein